MAHHAPQPRSRRLTTYVGPGSAASRVWRSSFATTLALVAGLVVGLVGGLVGGAPVHADPSVAEIERQIDVAWQKLEPIIEKQNATRQDLAAKKKQAEKLSKQIEPLQLQIELSMHRVREIAVRAYKGGNTSALNAILAGGSPSELMGQLTVLDRFARRQQQDIQAVVDLKQKYAAQKEPFDALVVKLTSSEVELAAKKKEIDAEIARLQKLRLKAYGSGAAGPLRPAPCPASYPGGASGTAVKFACAQIGKPYVWGASGPNAYDCSGLTMAAWAAAGVSLPHNAAAQRQVTANVSQANLRPGDLVYYYGDLHHVGMYVGDGWIVHASQAGEPLKMQKVDASPIHSFGRPG